jgi:hypothetical protein
MSDIQLSPYLGVYGDHPRLEEVVHGKDRQEDFSIDRWAICELAYHMLATALPAVPSPYVDFKPI